MSKEILYSELAGEVDPFTLNQVIKEAEEKGCLAELSQIQLKHKWVGLSLGCFFGGLGLDRFYAQSYICGFIKASMFCIALIITIIACFTEPSSVAMEKFLTSLGDFLSSIAGIWAFVDLFLVWHLIKKKNAEKLRLFVELYKAKDNK